MSNPDQACDIVGDHLFCEIDLGNKVAECWVRIDYDPEEFCDALVAAYANRERDTSVEPPVDKPVGQPIDDLSFPLSRFTNPNQCNFRVADIQRFSVLVRRTGAPGKLQKATFGYTLIERAGETTSSAA